jgi:hydroxymethylpyrimidine pyrophosphatase-like HAD family hydrolase
MEVAELVRAAVPGTTFAIEHTSGWASEDAFPHHPDDARDRRVGTWESIYADDVVKVLAVHRELDPEEFWRQVAAAVGDLVTTTWSSTFALVEISAAGVTKATTLARVAAEMGIGAADVVAFGDMPNDLPMLEWAGTSYAMANAHESVRDLAAHLAPANDEDGVATVLADLFGLSR